MFDEVLDSATPHRMLGNADAHHQLSQASASTSFPLAGSSTSTDPVAQPSLVQPPKKRRKLRFTSDLGVSIQRHNPDGSETVEWLHHQSKQRLKTKWEGIFEKFKDAHLQDQDEIYLGNRSNGEPLVVIKDRGSLRGLSRSLKFGDFIKDEELQGWKDRPEARQLEEEEDHAADSAGGWTTLRQATSKTTQMNSYGPPSDSEEDDDTDDPAHNDPDLREFLAAEARRKALQGEEDEEEDDEDVVDFRDPAWADGSIEQPSSPAVRRKIWQPPELVPHTHHHHHHRQHSSQHNPSQHNLSSASSSDDEADGILIDSDSEDDFDDLRRAKRDNIEDLVRCTNPFETLPYDDVFGLADLLGLSDKTARLYVDLVSESDGDEEVQQVWPKETTAKFPAEPFAESMEWSDRPLVVVPTIETRVGPVEQPVTELVPNLDPQKAPAVTTTKDVLHGPVIASTVPTPSSPTAELPPMEESAIEVADQSLDHCSVTMTEVPKSPPTTSRKSEERPAPPTQVTVVSQPKPSTSAPEPQRQSTPAAAPSCATPSLPAEASVQTPETKRSPIHQTSNSRTKGGAHKVKFATQSPSSSSVRSTTPSKNPRHKQKTRHRSSTVARYRSFKDGVEDENEDEDVLGTQQTSCGGPGKCTKTFCLSCAEIMRTA